MYAIFRAGGRQHRAKPGDVIDVEKLPYLPGASVELNEVLLVVPDGGSPLVGQPLVSGAVVQAVVVEHYRAEKVLIWKYRPGLRYRKRRGHRQTYTRLEIKDVVGI